MNWLTTLQPWHWLAAGVVLAVLEIAAPGAVFIWFGVAALIVGLLLTVIPLGWSVQFLLFALLSVGSIFAWHTYKKRNPHVESHPELNRRGAQLIGRVLTLDEPIVNRVGRARVGDSAWKIEGPDLPAGSQIRVTGVEGTVLIVESDD